MNLNFRFICSCCFLKFSETIEIDNIEKESDIFCPHCGSLSKLYHEILFESENEILDCEIQENMVDDNYVFEDVEDDEVYL